MQRFTGFTIWMALAVACARAAEPLTVPSEAEQKAAIAVVAEVYKPDYEKAKTPVQKLELARKLLLEGTATKDDQCSAVRALPHRPRHCRATR